MSALQSIPSMPHLEHHHTHRTGWLRAAVLGANDGIVSTASLVLGVAAAHASYDAVLIAGASGLVAGAIGAPPARADTPPRMAREASEKPATVGIRLLSGAATAVSKGSAAPTTKLAADANAA